METLSTLDDLVRSGKVHISNIIIIHCFNSIFYQVRYIGASSMYAWQFSKALHLAGLNHLNKFVTMQNHYSLLYREEEREMIPLCRDEGVCARARSCFVIIGLIVLQVGIIPFCPLGRGLLCRPVGTTTERISLDPITSKYVNISLFMLLLSFF